jgi:hypothetical protein
MAPHGMGWSQRRLIKSDLRIKNANMRKCTKMWLYKMFTADSVWITEAAAHCDYIDEPLAILE